MLLETGQASALAFNKKTAVNQIYSEIQRFFL